MDWLDFIFPKYGLTEVRRIKGGTAVSAFHSNVDKVITDVARYNWMGWDVYVGVLPRKTTGGTAEDVWPSATVLWCDVDAKDFCPDPVLHSPESKLKGDPDQDKSLALDAILKFPVTPSCIVDSGHGFHLYWKLHTPADTPAAVEVNRAIAKWLGGDKCFDAPRILRVPGTHNHKDPADPIPVRILKLDTLRTYDLSDFTEQVESLRSQELKRIAPIEDRRSDAPDWLREGLNTEPPKGSRSETEFRFGLWMARYGYSDDEILSALLNMPFGAKAQERGERWAEAEVRRIRSKA